MNFSRHMGQTAQANGQHSAQDFGGHEGVSGVRRGEQGISLSSSNWFHHQTSVFLQKVRLVIYWTMSGVFTLDFTRNLFVNGRKD